MHTVFPKMGWDSLEDDAPSPLHGCPPDWCLPYIGMVNVSLGSRNGQMSFLKLPPLPFLNSVTL